MHRRRLASRAGGPQRSCCTPRNRSCCCICCYGLRVVGLLYLAVIHEAPQAHPFKQVPQHFGLIPGAPLTTRLLGIFTPTCCYSCCCC
jgi:hypothetical protein